MQPSPHTETTMLIHALLTIALAVQPVATPTAAATKTGDSPVRKHTTLGVAIAPVPTAFRAVDYLEPNEGVLLVKIEAGSAAEAAQLRAGDIVLAINGKRVDETTLFATLREIPRGESFKIEYLHKERWRETSAKTD